MYMVIAHVRVDSKPLNDLSRLVSWLTGSFTTTYAGVIQCSQSPLYGKDIYGL